MSLLGPSNSWMRAWRHVEVVHLRVLDVAHALVVADRQRQERDHHHPAVDDVAIEQVDRVGDSHLLGGLVDLIDERIDPLGELVRGRDLDVRAGGGFGRKVSGRFQVAGARLGLHLVGDEDVPAAADQFVFAQAEVGVTVGLVHDCSFFSGIVLLLAGTIGVRVAQDN